MSEQELEDFLILRDMDEPMSEEELMAAGKRSNEVAQELRDGDVGIRWIETDVLMNEDEKVTGTICRYQAESEEAVREHADRAGLPATRIDRQGPTIKDVDGGQSAQ